MLFIKEVSVSVFVLGMIVLIFSGLGRIFMLWGYLLV